MKKLISIAIPVLNEEMNIVPVYRAVVDVMAPLSDRYDIEFVFTDNHSSDGTFERLREIAAKDPRVRAYRFSRNVGYQSSILAGYRQAAGDAVVQLDCDLQDPPSLIPIFLDWWEKGYKVVFGVRRSRKEGMVINFLRRAFYWLLNRISEDALPRDAGDFRLIDRVIVDNLGQPAGANLYLRGCIASMGFDQIGVEYDRDKRREGKSKFNFLANFRLAVAAITAYSALPLRLSGVFGFLVTLCSILLGASYLVAYLAYGASWPKGFASLFLLQLATLGILSFFLGILGEYVYQLTIAQRSLKVIIEESIDTRNNAAKPS